MKHIILCFLSVFPILSYAQLTLENEYDFEIHRTDFPLAGEKYWQVDYTSDQLQLFNSDHTPWKTINLPRPNGTGIPIVWDVSEDHINSNSAIEVTYTFTAMVNGLSGTEMRIVDENDSLLLQLDSCNYPVVSILDGLPNKILAYTYAPIKQTIVYEYSTLNAQHSFPGGLVERISFPTHGEKYFIPKKTDKEVDLFNADFSPWKTVELPLLATETFFSIQNISEDLINTNSNIEITYTHSKQSSSGFEASVCDDDGLLVHTFTNAHGVQLSKGYGLTQKFIVLVVKTGVDKEIYSLPGLNLEHSYQGPILRSYLQQDGEKYSIVNQSNNSIDMYNADHSFWKSIDLVLSPTEQLQQVFDVSQKKIDTNQSVEVIYNFGLMGTFYTFSRIADENQNILLTDSAFVITLDEKKGVPNKVFAYGDVYGTSSISTGVERVKKSVEIAIFPNPVSEILKIDLLDEPLNMIKIVDMEGKELIKINNPNNYTEINFSIFPPGAYLISGYLDNQMVFNRQVIKF